MTVIEPPRIDPQNPSHIKKNSAPVRFWHWANAIVITGSLLTVLLNSTLTNGRSNSTLIQNQLKDAGASVTNEQARSAAHALSDKVWEVHTYFGYCLAALLLFRLIAEFFQVADQKFIRKFKSIYSQYRSASGNKIIRHDFVVKTLYAMFYLLLIIMATTGLCLAFEDDIAALKKIHSIREIHGFCMYLILAFIVVHLAGVFLAERKDSAGIVSDMINGGEDK
ncbi:MAG: cytochrome b/b6 domain-containing protein [Sphingobacteriales bacterium]